MRDSIIDRLLYDKHITPEEAQELRGEIIVPGGGTYHRRQKSWIEAEMERRASHAKNCPCNPANGPKHGMTP